MFNFSKILGKKKYARLNNKGIGTVEIILILVVLIGLVIIFKEQLLGLIAGIFDSISEGSGTVMS
ncbi:MAG: hypothetical protein FWC09_01175 [Lachnospiraceae bacterium]|nr:hypothetical protein [Lachnospiraceae bacterium]